MDVHGHGSEWDFERKASRYWIGLETGAEFDGFGPTVESARLAAVAALAAAGWSLAELGGLGGSIREEIEADAIALGRCPGGVPLAPQQRDYALAFVAGTAIAVEFAEGALAGAIEVELAGSLVLPQGRVAAYDPLTVDTVATFDLRVVPGSYPVLVSLAQIPGEPRRRTIAAAVRFNERPVVEWKQALCEGEDPRELEPREMFGYTVDTGTGCFAAADFDPSNLRESPVEIEEFAQLHPEAVAFATGWGDGRYATFVGLDASGEPAMLVTDFELLAPNVL
jgi:hypothetical protein